MPAPRRERPKIPSGYGVAQDAEGMLEWDAVRDAIASAPTVWVATVRPDGRPHLTPLWSVFVDDRMVISGSASALWARNVAAGSGLDAGIDHEGVQATVRGTVVAVTPDAELTARVDAAAAAKYGHAFPPSDFHIVTPETIVAFEVARFEASGTRFVFDGA